MEQAAGFPHGRIVTKTRAMSTLHDFSVRTIDGRDVSLSTYKGRVVLLVNVASKCGFTKQYKGLEALHRELSPKGLSILGFPSNEFGGQEPGTDAEIQTFCSTTYDVTFDMFSKVVVKGDDKHPLFKFLTETGKDKGEIKWNFSKFLIGKDGTLIERFGSMVDPESKDLRKAIDAALA